MGNGLYLAQNCPDRPGILITVGQLYTTHAASYFPVY